ncbi:AtpZ/AtpI family protein [Gaoshiqia sediminis]|uniref:AtpZ/AtpI family protein n=1 Tax=Gaoshiqia sediminis TaxID=2986998 RepID=A0AA41Y4B0_9BACT|nr:AtpZ/AtpI family protein [Gaoshiqia sediminis]MCW0481644.1 AtpZ/AtpI family protein [Gaoshiqia sediminis]
MKNPNRNKPKKNFDQFIRYSSLAFEMITIMALGVFTGYKIDHWLGLSFPAFTLALMVLSVIGAIYHAIKNFLK